VSQTALCDFDGDGRLDYTVGGNGGNFVYRRNDDGTWTRYHLRRINLQGELAMTGRGPTDAGGTAADLDGDGFCDLIVGSSWYRNPGGRLDGDWQQYDYAEASGGNALVHDEILADINGDGRLDLVTMRDATNVRFYEIPEDPTQPWTRHDVGPSTHQGIAPRGFGDLNGDGRVDIVRNDVWFENTLRPDGTIWWRMHYLGPLMTLPPGSLVDDAGWANGAQSWVADINGDGRNDIVQADGETRGARVWWMENLGTEPDGSVRWRRHVIAGGLRTIVDGQSVYYGRVMGALHALCVGDFTGNGREDIVVFESDWARARPGANGEEQPRAFLYENLATGFDGTVLFHEHVIADVNLGGHNIVCGDIMGNGKLDIVAKPWGTQGGNASNVNALGGRYYVIVLENLTEPAE